MIETNNLAFGDPVEVKMTIIDDPVELIDAPAPSNSIPYKQERYYGTAGEFRELVKIDSKEGKALRRIVVNEFGVDPLDLGAPRIGQEIVSGVITTKAPESYMLAENGDITIALKFFVGSGEVAVKTTSLPLARITLPALPESALVGAVATYSEYSSFPFPKSCQDKVDIYFSGDHKDVCQFFDFDFPQGAFRTYYGASFRKSDLIITKMKSYTFDDNSPQSQWAEIASMHAFIVKSHKEKQE